MKKKKWKLYLYYNNICIKKIYVNDNFKPLEEIYIIRVLFKRFLLGSWNVKIVCTPKALKYTNNKTKEVHLEVELFGGV
jgi:hypothetical protein